MGNENYWELEIHLIISWKLGKGLFPGIWESEILFTGKWEMKITGN